MALIDGKPRSASAKVIDECKVILIDAEAFQDVISGVPPWFMSIVRMTSQKIRQANRHLQSINYEHQDCAIILLLYYQFKRYGDSNRIDLQPATLRLMQLLNTTQQNVVKVLEILDKNQLIEVKENVIAFIDPDKLREFCTFIRLSLRKAYDKPTLWSDETLSLIEGFVKENREIIEKEDGTTEIEGDRFWNFLESKGFKESYTEIIPSLKEEGFLTLQKKESAEKGQNPFSGAVIKLKNSLWYRYYLLKRFRKIMAML